MKLSHLSIGRKMGAAFFLVIALTAVLGSFALWQMRSVHANTEEIATNWLPSIKLLGTIRTYNNQFRRLEADHLLAFDAEEKKTLEKRMTEILAKTDEVTKAYAPLCSPQEQPSFAAYQKKREAYLAGHQRFLDLSREGINAFREAREAFMGETNVLFSDMVAEIGKLVDINDQGAHQAQEIARASYSATRLWVSVLLLGVILSGAALAAWTTRMITQPLQQAVAAAARVSEGDLSEPIVVTGSDETGQLLAALAEMKRKLNMLVAQVRRNAEGLAAASDQIAQGNHDLSARTESQASALQQTAASMEQLNSAVQQNTGGASQANDLAINASSVAKQGGQVVSMVIDTMKGINESSGKITDIIGVIESIAFQTNILALNAAVEAARAGEQGRGFAVVASEVRSLAGRSAQAAKEIKTLIQDSVERVEHGSALVDQAGSTMQEVVGAIERVTQIMGDITAASREQSAGVEQVSEAVSQMDQVTQQNAALVEEMAASASGLNQQARDLLGTVSVFKLEDTAAASQPRIAA